MGRWLVALLVLAGCSRSVLVGADTVVSDTTDADTVEVGTEVTEPETAPYRLIIALDITNSWAPQRFDGVRADLVALAADLAREAQAGDEVALTVFYNRFSLVFTPFTAVDDTAAMAGVVDSWNTLRTASKPGDGSHWPAPCRLHGGARQNDFTMPSGGCNPSMPREYRDEPGTDHATALEHVMAMLDDQGEVSRTVVLMVTDGYPNGLRLASQARVDDAYIETRWPTYVGAAPRSVEEVERLMTRYADELAATHAADIWVHTLIDVPVATGLVRGEGRFSVGEQATVFAELANWLAYERYDDGRER